jgi:hypothetical protein
MTVWSWAKVFGAPIDSVVAAEAMSTVDRLATEYIESRFDIIERDRTSGPLAKEFRTVKNPARTPHGDPCWRATARRIAAFDSGFSHARHHR